jgi:glutamate-5-semialdehyde dehydrogenase
MGKKLESLTTGMRIPYGGNNVATVSEALASEFESGDRLIVIQTTGDLLHVPADVWNISSETVERAHNAFLEIGSVDDELITQFFKLFADYLSDEERFSAIKDANNEDVRVAKSKGRSTTRLILSEKMREDMVDGLRLWENTPSQRGSIKEEISHDGWKVTLMTAGLGVVGFIFEGRPNVFADATGVLRSGNTVVFRIGSDALLTANAIVEHALDPALRESGLPNGSVSLINSAERSAGYAMFSDQRLALAVARGSGPAVAQLGSVAKQSGIPVSLHGTGGAWLVGSRNSNPEMFKSVIYHSLDRKVCNTLNTCCITREAASVLVPEFLTALKEAGEARGAAAKLHVTESADPFIPDEWRSDVTIERAEGEVVEPQTEEIEIEEIGVEWEWENSPEVTLVVVESLSEAIMLCNSYSPQFVASMVTENDEEFEAFFDGINAPFVGNGFTRWVDGQYALNRPELGLSNWQYGRLFGRGGVLSGDSIFTVRTLAIQETSEITRRS